MGAFTSLLGGFAQGAGEHIAEVNERKRQEQVQNTRLVNEALIDRIKNNPDATPEDTHALFRMVLKNAGMKPADIESVAQHAVGAGILPQKGGQKQAPQGGGQAAGQPLVGQDEMAGPVPQAGRQSQTTPTPNSPIPSGTSPLMGIPFTPPYGPHEDGSPMSYAEIQGNRKALAEHTLANTQSARDLAKTNAQEQAKLDRESTLAKQEHDRVLQDMQTGSAQGKHFNISMINNHERLVPDRGIIDGIAYGGTIHDSDKPLDADTLYNRRRFGDGKFEYEPISKGVTSIVNDPGSPTGAWKQVYDSNGTFITKVPVNPNAALLPTTTSGTHGVIHDVTDANGNVTTNVVPVGTSSTRSKVIPGASTTPNSPVPGIPIPKAGGGQGRSLGISPSQTKKEWENQYTGPTVKILQENEPVQAQIGRALSMLDSIKDVNQPLDFAVQRLGYSAGLATNASNLINNLELGKVIGAARVLKGSSRAISALEIAMTHLPNPKVDSPKLMVEKLKNIQQNLKDIEVSAKQEGMKYPNAPFNKNNPNPNSNIPKKPLSDIFKQ